MKLRDAIARGEYKPGQRLSEPALCDRFKTSRTPIREALRYLEKEDLVKITPNAGARVIKLSIKDASDIYDMLIALEGTACRLACSQIKAEEIRKLEEYEFSMLSAANEKNYDLLTQLNEQFHWLITESTGNSYLIKIRADFRRLVNPIGRFSAEIPEQLERTFEEHPKIVEAIKKRNSALAEFMAREHLENAKKFFLSYASQIGMFRDDNDESL